MFKMTDTQNNNQDDSEDPPSTAAGIPALQDRNSQVTKPNGIHGANGNVGGIFHWIKTAVRGKSDTTLREAIEEYIEEAENGSEDNTSSVSEHERTLISNILKLRDHTVLDAMIPRADIIAIDVNATQDELLSLLSERQHSRFPVYRETLDEIVGTIHIKDILGCLADNRVIEIEDLVRDVPIVSPSMQVLDLLLMMKQMRKHMALVVDEFGGIDGLVTINDVIESIVGEIEDEYDQDDDPQLAENTDGSVLADARYDIEEFEERFGEMLSEEEREDIDTLGGLVFSLAGRVPARGEILTHSSGMIFEVVDADPRRVNRLKIKNIPLPAA